LSVADTSEYVCQNVPGLSTGECPSFHLILGLILMGRSIALILAVTYLAWLMFGPIGAVFAVMVAVATGGAVFNPG
jgi:hypothetical protein